MNINEDHIPQQGRRPPGRMPEWEHDKVLDEREKNEAVK